MQEADKLRILIIDDTLDFFLARGRIDSQELLALSGVDSEVHVVATSYDAQEILANWADQSIRPDIVSVDFLFGQEKGPVTYADLKESVYKNRPELEPKKLFVHSKSGLHEYGVEGYQLANSLANQFGMEYAHTLEFYDLGLQFALGEEIVLKSIAPSTSSFRDYLRNKYEIPTRSHTRESIEREEFTDKIKDGVNLYKAYAALNEGLPADKVLMMIDPKKVAVEFRKTLQRHNPQKNFAEYYSRPVYFSKAAGGAASGVAAFNAEEVRKYKQEGKQVILVLDNFTPDNLSLLKDIDGIVLLGRGSSHLMLLCESFGIAAVLKQQGARTYSNDKILSIIGEESNSRLLSHDQNNEGFDFEIISGQEISIAEYHYVTVDGGEPVEQCIGQLYPVALKVIDQNVDDFIEESVIRVLNDARKMEWHRRDNPSCHGLGVKANADSPEQIIKAAKVHADAIGLLRTEHMFLSEERLPVLQSYFSADKREEKEAALAKLAELSKQDFAAIYKAAKEAEEIRKDSLLPFTVTIRLLDFKPDEVLNNPELQNRHHDVEIYKTQLKAIFAAAQEAKIEQPEIMVPMIRSSDEAMAIRNIADEAAREFGYYEGAQRGYKFGCMIETLDAINHSRSIAMLCDFISFGTNDLTAEVTGIARDDIDAVDKWMEQHRQENPYRQLCSEVLAQMEKTIRMARGINPEIKINVCGAQVSGDEKSITFCQKMDLDAISVSPTTGALMFGQTVAAQQAFKAYHEVRAENKRVKRLGQTEIGGVAA